VSCFTENGEAAKQWLIVIVKHTSSANVILKILKTVFHIIDFNSENLAAKIQFLVSVAKLFDLIFVSRDFWWEKV
jgi:hypothetical protein